MGEVLVFPAKDRSFEPIRDVLLGTLRKHGVPDEIALEAINEYRPIHDRLFDPEKGIISLPAEAAITDEQAALIGPAIQQFHLERMGVAANAIVGLIARQKMDALQPEQ